MGLERFEVDKTRAFSLDFPEIPEITEILEMGFTSGAVLWTYFPKPKSALTSADDARCIERDPSGGAWGGGSPPNVSTPFPTWLNWSEAIQKVASNQLKIGQRVAHG